MPRLNLPPPVDTEDGDPTNLVREICSEIAASQGDDTVINTPKASGKHSPNDGRDGPEDLETNRDDSIYRTDGEYERRVFGRADNVSVPDEDDFFM